MNKFFGIGLVVVVIIIGGFLFINNSRTNQNPQQQQVSPTTSNVQGASAAAQTESATSEVKTIEVEAGSFYYKPNEIKVKKGEKVKIVMHSVSMMHDFNIDELNVHMPVTQNGTTGTVEFKADKVGSFEYYCSVGQHRKMGQVGTLIVEE